MAAKLGVLVLSILICKIHSQSVEVNTNVDYFQFALPPTQLSYPPQYIPAPLPPPQVVIPPQPCQQPTITLSPPTSSPQPIFLPNPIQPPTVTFPAQPLFPTIEIQEEFSINVPPTPTLTLPPPAPFPQPVFFPPPTPITFPGQPTFIPPPAVPPTIEIQEQVSINVPPSPPKLTLPPVPVTIPQPVVLPPSQVVLPPPQVVLPPPQVVVPPPQIPLITTTVVDNSLANKLANLLQLYIVSKTIDSNINPYCTSPFFSDIAPLYDAIGAIGTNSYQVTPLYAPYDVIGTVPCDLSPLYAPYGVADISVPVFGTDIYGTVTEVFPANIGAVSEVISPFGDYYTYPVGTEILVPGPLGYYPQILEPLPTLVDQLVYY